MLRRKRGLSLQRDGATRATQSATVMGVDHVLNVWQRRRATTQQTGQANGEHHTPILEVPAETPHRLAPEPPEACAPRPPATDPVTSKPPRFVGPPHHRAAFATAVAQAPRLVERELDGYVDCGALRRMWS